jgi:endonuclease/exonuclease/phosphatase family metal-dependent hydrolase
MRLSQGLSNFTRRFFMTRIEQASSQGQDRTFLHLSSKMAEPFCAAWGLLRYRWVAPLDPKKFENCASREKEVAVRAMIGLGACLSAFLLRIRPVPILSSVVILGLGSKVMRAIGFSMQKGGYTHIRGESPEKSLNARDPQVKVMTWNICGVGGGVSLDHGGVINWRSRLDAIVEKIKNESPDVLVLQEIYDTALGEALIERLKKDYAHFYTHLGPNVWGSVGGCMVLSKCAVHDFSYTSFSNNKWTLNRGFAVLELKASPQDFLPIARIIGTQLIHGNAPEDKKNRAEQIGQIINNVMHRVLLLPTILVGDLNIERDQEEGATLSSYLHHGYRGIEPTRTNRLAAQWDGKSRKEETIDYISLFKSASADATISIKGCHLVKAFDKSYNTKTALSDHHGLSATLKGFSLGLS